MGYCYAMSGRREEALAELRHLTAQSQTQYVSPASLAVIHAGLGDSAQALNCLEQAVEAHDPSLPLHLLSAEFDSLRPIPRFQDLRQRIGCRQQQLPE